MHVVDVHRARLKFPALRQKVIDLARAHDVIIVLVKDAGSGQQFIQSMQADRMLVYRADQRARTKKG